MVIKSCEFFDCEGISITNKMAMEIFEILAANGVITLAELERVKGEPMMPNKPICGPAKDIETPIKSAIKKMRVFWRDRKTANEMQELVRPLCSARDD